MNIIIFLIILIFSSIVCKMCFNAYYKMLVLNFFQEYVIFFVGIRLLLIPYKMEDRLILSKKPRVFYIMSPVCCLFGALGEIVPCVFDCTCICRD